LPLQLVQKHFNVFQMRIVCYFINWNDKYYLPFIKSHYEKFCQKIVMYDNYSTDGSDSLAAYLGMEVRNFGRRGELNDQHYLDVKNHCWKEERGKADYVIVCDADEFIIPDDLRGSAPVVTGYNMISDSIPRNSLMEINTGSVDVGYSKQAIFDPDLISEINYVHGCHKNRMEGEITREGNCKLLHYRMIGGVERILERHQEYRNRMSKFNLKFNMGHHYLHEENAKRVEWDHLKSKAVELW
jgi:hypothetical protein